MLIFEEKYFKAWFPVFTLLFGAGIQRLISFYEKKRTIKNNGKKWLYSIELLEEPINAQIKILKEFQEKLREDKFESPKLHAQILLKSERFKSINRIEFIAYLEDKLKSERSGIEVANKILGVTEVISSLFDMIEYRFNSYNTKAGSCFVEWYKNITALNRENTQLMVEIERNNGDPTKDVLLFTIHELWRTELKEKELKVELFENEENFLKPLLTHLGKYRKDLRIDRLKPYVLNSLDNVLAIKQEKRYLDENIGSIIIHLQENLDKLKNHIHSIKSDNMNTIDSKEFKEKFIDKGLGDNQQEDERNKESKQKNALDKAHEIRKFEIEMYWKRATYFWAFIAAAYVAFFAMLSNRSPLITQWEKTKYTLLISSLGIVVSFAWYLVNRGSKHWQNNWEKIIDELEDEITGPLYKHSLKDNAKMYQLFKSYPFSVSKINQIVSLFNVALWVTIIGDITCKNSDNICSKTFIVSYSLIALTCIVLVWQGKTKISPNNINEFISRK